MRFLLLFILLLPCAAEERIGLDPALRGIWKVVGEIDEEGMFEWYDVPFELCQASALSFRFGAKGSVAVKRVEIHNNISDGSPMNMVLIENGKILVVDQFETNLQYFSLQMFEGEEETHHLIIKVVK